MATVEDKAAAKAAKEAEKAAAKAAKESAVDGEIVVKYRDHQGETVLRTFSEAVHGEDFEQLADEFKATNAARIVG